MKPWVLVSLLTEHQEYQALQARDARDVAARGGLEARVVFAESDPTKQIQQITTGISAPEASRPLAVVAETAGSVGFERVARTALEAKVGWILVSDSPRYLDALHREFPDRLVAAASVNNEDMGQLLGRMALTLLPGGGKLLVIEGPTTTAATLQRRRGLEVGIRGSRLQIAKTLGADWTGPTAQKVAEAWLRLAGKSAVKPDLVVAFNDEMAVGVLGAVAAVRPDWGRIPAIGCDGLPSGGQRLVREGVLAGTIVTPASAGAGMELLLRARRGEEVPLVSSVRAWAFPALEELAARHGGGHPPAGHPV